jgi:hypothetical protein
MKAPGRIPLLGLVVFTAACASSDGAKQAPPRDIGDVPAQQRPGYGNETLHSWWPLTLPEAAALHGLDQARQGDARALLALAIVASGDHREPADHAGYQQRVDRFVAEVKPTIDAAADLWHKGYELHRAMHRTFFAGGSGDLKGYEFDQARVTGIFAGGHYNCLSSAMLFAVLARSFELPVRAVFVPTHVFIEMGEPGGKIIEVETTSATGFDWIHDERFYKEEAASWSGQRGLRPVTLDDYQHRRIVAPYQMMAKAMGEARRAESELDRNRLYELAGLVDPDDPELQRNRLGIYLNEANELSKQNAWRTVAKMFDTVSPTVADAGARSKDSKVLERVSWVTMYHAEALMVVGRQEEAIALMGDGITRLDASWPDGAKLRNNYLSVLSNRLVTLIDRRDYPTAVQAIAKYRDLCVSNEVCSHNASVIYTNWSIDHGNKGDWHSARQVLQDCVSQLPDDKKCREKLADLESRHRF